MKKCLVILMSLVVCLSGVVMAASTPEDVEAVLTGATYLDLRSDNPSDNPPGPYVRNGVTLTTSGDDWNYPDGSDSWVTVYGRGLDDRSGSDPDFPATISGLDSGQTYEVYAMATGRSVSGGYDFEWGTSQASLTLVSPVSQAPGGIIVVQDFDGGGDAVELYAIPIGSYQADTNGELVFWFGSNDGHGAGRTILDGISIVGVRYVDAPSIIGAANNSLQVTLNVIGETPESITWTQTGGPATVVPTLDSGLTYSATYTVGGDYVYAVQAQWAGGTITKTDTCVISVVNPADNAIVAHWDFEGLPADPNLPDVANDYDGVVGGSGGDDGEPNAIAGFISTTACDFLGETHWTITDPYASDPNFADLGYGLTIASWLKIDSPDVGRVLVIDDVIEYGARDDGTTWFQINRTDYYTDFYIADGGWHFFAVTVDPVNGELKYFLDGTTVRTWTIDKAKLFELTNTAVLIGNRADLERAFVGACDDLKVYNYPLTEAELMALTAEGDMPAIMTAGPDQDVNYNGTPVQLEGALLYDDGIPAASTLTWSVIGVPTGVNPANVVFASASAADTTVTFPPTEGVYTLRLTVDDSSGSPLTDDVNITITLPTCEDVIGDGYKQAADISGPAGVPDCRIDIYDFAAMAQGWLDCVDPQDVTCDWPYPAQ